MTKLLTVALLLLALAILVSSALVVGEMRYRDCQHQRDQQARGNLIRGVPPQTPSCAGCSHSPF